MKLYITLDNEKGNKIERLINFSDIPNMPVKGGIMWLEIIDSMLDSLEKVEQDKKDEELVNEAKRLSQHSD